MITLIRHWFWWSIFWSTSEHSIIFFSVS